MSPCFGTDTAGLSCPPDSNSVSEPWPAPGHAFMPLTVLWCLPGWHLSVSWVLQAQLSLKVLLVYLLFFSLSSLIPSPSKGLQKTLLSVSGPRAVCRTSASTQLACSLNLLEVGFPVLSPVGGPFSGLGFTTSLLLKQPLLRFVAIQSLNCVRLFVTPWTAAHQASLSFTISWSLLKFMSIELVMLSNHLILCHPLLHFFSFFFFFLLQLLGLKTSILFLKVSPCILTFKGFKGVTCPTGSIFLSAPSFMVSLSSASGSGPFLTCVWRWLKLLFLVSLSSPPTAVKLCDCWPWTSNSR